MGFYAQYLLPKIIDCAMTREPIMRLRAAHVPEARGSVLEIGIGSGVNLPFYTNAVTHVCGVDPSVPLLSTARRRAARAAFPVDLLNQPGERLPLASNSIDTAVVTWTLCSVAHPGDTLREIHRTLKPGGTLIFVEHGLADDLAVRKWQNRLTPAWRRLAGGCHLNRKVDDLIRDAGLTIAALTTEYIPGPRALTFMYRGRAEKR